MNAPDRGNNQQDRSSLSRSTWAALAAGMVLLIAALVFIVQNLASVKVSFVTAHWRIPLGVDLLFASIAGGLIVFIAGSVRIVQLTRLARRQERRLMRHLEAERTGREDPRGGDTGRTDLL